MPAPVANITPAELAQCCNNGDSLLLLDVRMPSEHLEVRIEGVKLVPLDQIKAKAFVEEHGHERDCVVICRGGMRAAKAADMLAAAGMTKLRILEGGMLAWEQEGLPVQRSGRKVMPLDRQVRIAIGMIVLAGYIIGSWVNPWGFALCGFMGAALIFSGIADFCGLAMLLSKAPWNQANADCGCAGAAN